VAANTKVTFTPITEIDSSGIHTKDGEHHEFDIIICATGFHIGFLPFFELKGKNGIDIRDTWNPEPK